MYAVTARSQVRVNFLHLCDDRADDCVQLGACQIVPYCLVFHSAVFSLLHAHTDSLHKLMRVKNERNT